MQLVQLLLRRGPYCLDLNFMCSLVSSSSDAVVQDMLTFSGLCYVYRWLVSCLHILVSYVSQVTYPMELASLLHLAPLALTLLICKLEPAPLFGENDNFKQPLCSIAGLY